jgi:hypothetical protein
MLHDYDLSLLYVHCILSKRQKILCKKRKKKKKKKKKEKKKEREKEKSMISMPRSSSLSSKKGEKRYPKTSTAKFFINSLIGGSLSRSKVELG